MNQRGFLERITDWLDGNELVLGILIGGAGILLFGWLFS